VNQPPLADAPGLRAGDAGATQDDAPMTRRGENQPPSPDAELANLANLATKEARLRTLLNDLPSIIVAYSGGVDSAYLAYAATAALGSRALCVTADSPSYPDRHRQIALSLARQFGFQHKVIHTAELERAEYRANPANRCYYCKQELYSHLSALARDRGIPVIADGSNADDRGDYRPGRQAARELGVRSPLDEAGLTKDEIRELSRRAGLPTWNEPASACLSSRIPYFSEVTDEKLRMIEQAEAALRDFGFRICRVRHHDALARIELGQDEIARALAPEMADAIDRALRAIGYQYVTIDVRGYRLGSLNEALRLRPVQ
jgi:pyridinium-3,5-biscarboxylic acid mononucleotide sulfurtransferase